MSNNYEHFSWPINKGFGEIEGTKEKCKLHSMSDLEHTPMKLREALIVCKQAALEMKKSYEEPYPIKNAQIDFEYENISYILYPELFDIEDSQFEIMSDKILSVLKDCGCSSGHYSGFMD